MGAELAGGAAVGCAVAGEEGATDVGGFVAVTGVATCGGGSPAHPSNVDVNAKTKTPDKNPEFIAKTSTPSTLREKERQHASAKLQKWGRKRDP
jgi:hypothetical protein